MRPPVSVGFAILFTATHNADVLQTVSQLKAQGCPSQNIMLFQGSAVPPTISYAPVHVPDAKTASNLGRIYAWFLRTASQTFTHVVILEDDLWLSPHFVAYMRWARLVLDLAPDVVVASAWNDNAVPEVSLSPSLFWRASQFMGLGWIAASSTLEAFADAILAAPQTVWDQSVATHMLRRSKVAIFPQYPRVRHRTASFWKFDTLQVFNRSSCAMPPAWHFARRYKNYLRSVCLVAYRHVHTNNLQAAVDSSNLPIPWATSALTSDTYGLHNGITVFPDKAGNQHIFSSRPLPNCSLE